MAPQHDFILDNQNGAQFRQDLNLALEAIATVSSGAVEPTTTYAYQYWADTTTNYLKQRDASNAGWIVRGKITEDYGQAGQVLTSAGSGLPAVWTSITEDGAWTVAQDSTNAHFTFTGNGFDGTEANPDIYLVRGQVYNFTNASTTKGFQIQSTAGLSGTAYSDGITNNPALAPDASTTETLVWTVQMDAPSELYYHSTVDAGPGGNIYILDEDTGGALEWTLTANGTSDYIFAGPGFAGTETDPDLYVVRGQTYKFTNSMGAHPFQIQSTQGLGGTAYNDGITNNGVSNGTLTWEVRMDAPSTLYYQCTAHALMAGVIYVLDEGSTVASIDDLSDVDTSTVAPTNGQALVWDNTAQKWEPGTVSGGGGTTLPSANDGEALIYENGQWVAGPVIGGVNYIPASGDSYFSSVELLLLGNGTNGSTTFTDSSSNARTATVSGNTQISTTQSKFGGSSIYFDGSGDYLEFAPDTNLIDWHTGGAFTVEAWVYASSWSGWSLSSQLPSLCGNSAATALTGYWTFGPNTSGNIVFQYYNGSTVALTGSTALTTGAWHHIAMSYDGTTIRVFADGVLDASNTVSGTPQTSLSYNFTVGSLNNTSITGYVDDLRVTQGVARYTSSFTPPSAELPTAGGTLVSIPYSIDKLDDVDTSTVAPTDGQALVWDNANSQWEPGTVSGGGTTLPSAADGAALIYENGQWISGPVIGGVSYTSAADPEYNNVQLLLHCNGTNGSTTFTDSSQNGLNVTANGNSQISTAQYKFGGASAYFDGASNGIQVSNSALITGTGQFTIEMWFYALNLDGGLAQSQQFNGGYELGLYTSGLKFWTYNGSDVLTTTAPSTNAWHHVAVTRDASNTLRMFVDGVLADSATNFTENLYRNTLIIGTSRTNFYDFDGYVDDFRLTTGVARYTAAFTPPTAQHLGAGSPVTIPYSIDNLDDVDTSTVAPTDGQSLVWDNANSKWEPGSLGIEDLDDFQLQATPPVSAYHDQKQSDGDFTNTGSTTGGFALDTSLTTHDSIYINKNAPTSGTSLASQGFTAGTDLDLWVSSDGINFTQHTAANSFNQGGSNAQFYRLSPDLTAYSSANALYFSLTSVAGTPIALAEGDVIQYESATSKFRPVQLGVDDLSDVDTSTVAPTDGQALVWDNVNSKWEPGTVGGSVTSVNTQTGAVSLGVEDLDDFALNISPNPFGSYDFTDSWFSPPDEPYRNRYYVNSTTREISINWFDKNTAAIDTALQGDISPLTSGDVITVLLYNKSTTTKYYLELSANPVVYNAGGANNDGYTLTVVDDTGWQSFSAANPNGLPEGLRVIAGDDRTTPLTALADGDILQYVSADSKFKPAQAAGVRSLLGIEEYADDAAAGTGGLSSGELYYNTTSSSYVLKT